MPKTFWLSRSYVHKDEVEVLGDVLGFGFWDGDVAVDVVVGDVVEDSPNKNRRNPTINP